jgi:hypothetical protein
MKTFSQFLEEAKIDWNAGPRAKAERKLSSLGRQMRTANPSQMVNVANRIKQMRSKISLENEKNPPAPQKQGISGIARGGVPQTPKDGPKAPRDPRLGPTRQQRASDASATRMVGSVERGATVVRRNSDGTTTRVAANFTRDPINIRSDATRQERRSNSSRTTERPEVGRWRGDRPAENAPDTFRRKNR